MSEELTFHFDGGIAASNKMNFYEAARFQYDAARLLVKLDQFRQSGGFVKKITNSNNRQILLKPHSPGSFEISLVTSEKSDDGTGFIDVPLSTLLAYVGERVIGKTADGMIAAILNGHSELVDRFGSVEEGSPIDDLILDILNTPSLRQKLSKETLEILERRFAEIARDQAIANEIDNVAKIDSHREQKLISMAAPLLSGMATAFRRSAKTMKVVAKRGVTEQNIIYLNKDLAHEIGSSKIDKEITPILGNIIQYNKETGWGKVRLDIISNPLSFSVPSDLKSELQSKLVLAMREDSTYLQIKFVRDRVGEIVRANIVGVIPMLI